MTNYNFKHVRRIKYDFVTIQDITDLNLLKGLQNEVAGRIQAEFRLTALTSEKH